MTLFERWEIVAAQNNPSAIVLRDPGNAWSFSDLRKLLAGRPRATVPVVVRGNGVDFILGTLTAWRDRQPLVPVESNDAAPALADLPDWVAHVKTTSGSTGTPRQILFREEQLAADAGQIVATMNLRAGLPNLGAISLAHSYGFSNLVLPLLLHGIPLILAETPLPNAIRRALDSGDAFSLPAVPAMWRAWHDAGVISGKIAIAISAGAPLSTDLERDVFETTGVKIHNFLGSSECGGIAYDRSPEPRDSGTDWIGTAMQGATLTTGEQGTLQVRSPAVGETYWPEPAEALHDGVFITSDLAVVDETGVYLKGRETDVINVAGRKIDPAEIENVLARHPAVRHVVVFGRASSHPERVEDIVAVLNAPESDLDAVKNHARERLTAWKVPRIWITDATLEPDARGKISRSAWKERARLGLPQVD